MRNELTVALFHKDFAGVFSNLLQEGRVTCYQISQYSHLDEAYLSRLKNGNKNNPSPETIVKICLALAHFGHKLSIYDFDKLFSAAGHSLLLNTK